MPMPTNFFPAFQHLLIKEYILFHHQQYGREAQIVVKSFNKNVTQSFRGTFSFPESTVNVSGCIHFLSQEWAWT